ncbi:MAG TPA: ATP-binding protein [Deltaproteobacteria bacterium]|nr:ATP-binding protein [Deltaproteobacteria bacterium]HOM28911.1 ATP-binding protein [Deltaproteobacteria bacterium]HPP80158.1 ATP-binding protein [Deltaproteobacteria bacterium]
MEDIVLDVCTPFGYMGSMNLETFREVLELAPVGVLLADEHGGVLWANGAALELLGISWQNLPELNVDGLMDADSPRRETMTRTKGNEHVTLRLMKRTMKNGMSVVFLSDISEVHRLQSEILKMDKLASVGELTSGIAHEIRNPLAGIKTTAQALDRELNPQDPRRAYLSRIIAEIDRLNKLLTGFFDFARPRKLALVSCDLAKVVEAALGMVKAHARENRVRTLEFYPRAEVAVKADPNLLQQVFMNVFLNAIEAMEFGGRMEVHVLDRGKHVEVVVSDTGRGVPENVQGKIFDPFFTTKPKGVGLGLSISYRIVKQHAGDITFESSPGGTTFIITLPKDPGKAG